MRKMKKIVSILLAATMVLTSMNVLTFSSVASADEVAETPTLVLTSTESRLQGQAYSSTAGSGATHDMLSLVNAPVLENLDAYVGRTYGIMQLGEAFVDEDVYLLAKPEALANVKTSVAGKTVKERYGESTPGEALYSFVAPQAGTIYTLSNIDMASTYTDNLAAHDYWTAYPPSLLVGIRAQVRDSIAGNGRDTKFWASEYCILEKNEEITMPPSPVKSINLGLYVARLIHTNLAVANASAWQWWTAV